MLKLASIEPCAARPRPDQSAPEEETTGSDSDTSQDCFPAPLGDTYILPEPFHVSCPWCPVAPFTDLDHCLAHLKTSHGFTVFQPHEVCAVLPAYLAAYARRALPSTHLGDPANYPADLALRRQLFHERLERVLADQTRERESEAKVPRPCLFCKFVPPDRHQLFRHMFSEHNFNIGNPENMVYVSHFLDLLSTELAELRCLYCANTFKDARTLRSHMRKKNHFRIPSTAVQYDRFYLINYLENGKNWETLLSEQEEEDDEGAAAAADGWSDWDAPQDPAAVLCLWCDEAADSAVDCVAHMLACHDFDLLALVRRCTDHQAIRWVNYLRYTRRQGVCPAPETCAAATPPHVACLRPAVARQTAARAMPPPVCAAPLDVRALGDAAQTLHTLGAVPIAHMHRLRISETHPDTPPSDSLKVPDASAPEEESRHQRPGWEDPQFLLPILDADPLIPYVLQYTLQEEDNEVVE